MKKIILFTLGAMLAIPAFAQTEGVTTFQSLGVTNNVLAATTNTANVVIDCRKQSTVLLTAKFNFDAATAGVIPCLILKSGDGINYETTGVTVNFTANGTNVIVGTTNLDSKGAAFMKLSTIANTNATANLTNLSIGYVIKTKAP